MALTLRQDGTTAANRVTSAWFNDYYDLLTGAMTDQSVTLDYAPAASGSTPTLALKGNGNGPLVAGYDTDGATVRFSLDHAGNLSLSGTGSFGGTVTFGGDLTANRQAAGVVSPWAPGISFGDGTGWKFPFKKDDGTQVAYIQDDGSIHGAFVSAQGGTSYLSNLDIGPAGGPYANFSVDTTNHYVNLWAPSPSGTGYSMDFHPWSGTANPAALHLDAAGWVSFTVMDGAAGTLRTIRIFIGATDPSTYTTVNEGDIWIRA